MDDYLGFNINNFGDGHSNGNGFGDGHGDGDGFGYGYVFGEKRNIDSFFYKKGMKRWR